MVTTASPFPARLESPPIPPPPIPPPPLHTIHDEQLTVKCTPSVVKQGLNIGIETLMALSKYRQRTMLAS